MDPLVEALHRWRLLRADHSLDGLPVTAFVVGLVLVIGTTLALRWTGRSYRSWHGFAFCVFSAWWAGVLLGHFGWSGPTILWTVLLPFVVFEPMVRTVRAALVPVDRDRAAEHARR